MIRARVEVTLKPGVLDPAGKAIQHALGTLGFDGVAGVRQSRVLALDLDETDAAKAREEVDRMCRNLLANTVIENYTITIDG